MSKLWTNRFGDGCKSAPRGLRIGRGVFSLCLMLGLIVSAASAWAAEVTEVRIGRHPTFTRLVFELDRAAGYRIQRTDAGADSELVISLEASSMPRNLRSSKTLIEQVDVTPNGSRSVARIRLTEDGFRLKEMILSNPPRIVLDLVSEKAVAKAATNKPKISSTVSRAAAEATARATATEKLAAETKKLGDASKSSAAAAKNSASAAADRVMVTAKTTVKATSDTVSNAASKSKEMASNARAAASDKVADINKKAEELSFDDFDEIIDRNSAASDTAAAKVPDASDAVNARTGTAGSASTPNAAPQVSKAEPKPKTPRPMVAKKTTEDENGWMKWALVAAVALVVGGAGLLFVRRSSGDEEVDFSEGEDEVDFGDDPATIMTSDEDKNPFADLAGGHDTVADAAATTVTPFADDDGMDGEGTTIVPIADDDKESETIVFESIQENNMDDMEVISRDQVNESLGDAAMPPVGGIPEEFQQMMREMNRRVESLEGRVDELVDARDRLERQVAAQTEELRVQRAAIARTQRAVRNLARPEDAGEEEATEPALRDPNQ